MIKIIHPKDHDFYKAKIEALLDLFKVYQKIDLLPEERSTTTFMIAEDRKRGIYGGALLTQEYLGDLEDRVGKTIAALSLNKRRVWVARICFCIEEREPFSALEQIDLCENFYDDLYRRFIKLGAQEKTRFLVLTLHPTDFFRTKTYGHWPYLLEVQPNEARNKLFHGILPLKPEKHALYKSTWSTIQRLRQFRRRR